MKDITNSIKNKVENTINSIKQKRNNIVPLKYRAFSKFMTDSNAPITEKDMSDSEKEELNKIVKVNTNNKIKTIRYSDYRNISTKDSLNPSKGVSKYGYDPDENNKTKMSEVTGRAEISDDSANTKSNYYHVKDKYDFNNHLKGDNLLSAFKFNRQHNKDVDKYAEDNYKEKSINGILRKNFRRLASYKDNDNLHTDIQTNVLTPKGKANSLKNKKQDVVSKSQNIKETNTVSSKSKTNNTPIKSKANSNEAFKLASKDKSRIKTDSKGNKYVEDLKGNPFKYAFKKI